MANPVLLARAGFTIATDERIRKAAGWTVVAVLSPLILLVAFFCALGSGTSSHNISAVELCFNGGAIPDSFPEEYRICIKEMQSSLSELDEVISAIDGQTENEASLDATRVKAIFYALYFGAEHQPEPQWFADCFVTYEERTKTVTVENEDGTTAEVEEIYMVAVPIEDLSQVYLNIRSTLGTEVTTEHQSNAESMSTVLSRLNAFLDSELEQVLCFDSAIDAEKFSSQKSAIFLILPEEDPSKNFMAGLMIQTLSRELFSVADENGGKLPNRVVLFCDELGTMPAFDILPLFSAGRSRKLTLVPIIQSLAQLEKNYGKEGAEIIQDNVQDTIFGGFAPNSQTAEVLSKSLGSRTVLSGSISRGKEKSQSLQMMERPLMTPDELKSIPKGQFVVMKTGTHPMQTRLRLFLEWGISFEEPYQMEEKAQRSVAYASKKELEQAILQRHPAEPEAPPAPPRPATAASGSQYRRNRWGQESEMRTRPKKDGDGP